MPTNLTGRVRQIGRRQILKSIAPALALASLIAAGSVQAADVKLPAAMTIPAAGAGVTQSNILAQIVLAIQKTYGTTVDMPAPAVAGDVLPAFASLRDGKAPLIAGAQSIVAVDGTGPFAVPNGGPQRLRAVTECRLPNGNLVSAADAKIRSYADLKGKRVAVPAAAGNAVVAPGNPVTAATIDNNTAAALAFAGLTAQDIIRVEVADFAAGYAAMVAGRADAMLTGVGLAGGVGGTADPGAFDLAKSPRGIFWVPAPANDQAGWVRMKTVIANNNWIPGMVTEGAGLSGATPHAGVTVIQANIMTRPEQEADLVYSMAKAVFSTFEQWQGKAGWINGCGVAQQAFEGDVPWHDGAIRYFKEVGLWSESHQKWNDQLVKRQDVLAAAWTKAKAGTYANDAAFTTAWLKVRADALRAAGFEPYVAE